MSEDVTTVVIVGRPNVGKSTLFNRLAGRRRALVHNEPGVTRDRIEERTSWWVAAKRYPVKLIDTGGVGGERFTAEIREQVDAALEEADVVLLLFDAQQGLTAADRTLIRELHRAGVKPIVAVANKIDEEKHEPMGAEFYEAGLGDVHTISAEHGRGIDDLEAAAIAAAGAKPTLEEEVAEVRLPRIAIVGRPNVGKSTFVNAVLGQNRMVTSPIAGTTVDAIDSVVELGGKNFVLVDTAGIRRKGKTEQGIEVLSVVQACKALERAELAILMLDGETGISDQDEKIGGLIEDAGCSVVLCMNKWDTQRGNKKFTQESAAERIRGKFGFMKHAPIVFVSAKEKRGFDDLGELVADILHQRRIKIPTHELTEWVRKEATIHNPSNAKFFVSHQSGSHPPTFVFHVNDPDKIHFSLQRHLVNAMRERWGFMGSPVRLRFVMSERKSLPKPKPKLKAK